MSKITNYTIAALLLLTIDVNAITHNGTTYGSVKSPYTGKVWLDRNLGAKRICKSFDDKQCYGDYYQWGRPADGHEKPDSNNFVKSNLDWNNNLSNEQRIKYWKRTDGKGICPRGFRVPTWQEFSDETLKQGIYGGKDLFKSFLKIPISGVRDASDGNIEGQGKYIYGALWTLDPRGGKGSVVDQIDTFYIEQNVLDSMLYPQATGLPVRCIKE